MMGCCRHTMSCCVSVYLCFVGWGRVVTKRTQQKIPIEENEVPKAYYELASGGLLLYRDYSRRSFVARCWIDVRIRSARQPFYPKIYQMGGTSSSTVLTFHNRRVEAVTMIARFVLCCYLTKVLGF